LGRCQEIREGSENMEESETVEMDHFIYGSYKGYCVKAKSAGIDGAETTRESPSMIS